MGWKKIGIACCLGLKKEGTMLARILESRDFEVKGIFCKTGSVPKEFLGIARDKMLKKEGFEAMCNPIAQAVLLGKEKTAECDNGSLHGPRYIVLEAFEGTHYNACGQRSDSLP